MTWTRIDCARSGEVYEAIANRAPLAGRSDMGGKFGEPIIETTWGNRETGEEVLKNVRHPRYEWDSRAGDREPCEHYEWVQP